MSESDVVRKVRKLLELARNNPSAEESAAAAAKAQELIEQHRIDEALLMAEQEKPAEEKLRDVSERVIYHFKGRNLVHWICSLGSGVAQANGLYSWHGWKNGRRTYEAAGPLDDLIAVEVLLDWLVAEVGHLIAQERREGRSEPGRSWGNSFRMGCAYMIGKRLREASYANKQRLKRQAEPDRDERYRLALEAGDQDMILAMDCERGEQSKQYSLAVVETALRLIEEQKVENKRWAKETHSFKSSSYGGTAWGGGYSSGVAAGKRARINAPKRLA